MLQWSVIGLYFVLNMVTISQDITMMTVNSTPVSVGDFQIRYRLEVFLIQQEIDAYGCVLYAQLPDENQVLNTVQTVYRSQIEALYNPQQFAETILNSMVFDMLLIDFAQEAGTFPHADAVDFAVRLHVARVDNISLSGLPNPLATNPQIEVAIDQFYQGAEQASGANREAVRDLFAMRLLREQVQDAVTVNFAPQGGLLLPNTDPGLNNRIFQGWVFNALQNADIQRADDWQTYVPVSGENLPEILSHGPDSVCR